MELHYVRLVGANRYSFQQRIFERGKIYRVNTEKADHLLGQVDSFNGMPYFEEVDMPSPKTGKAAAKKKVTKKKVTKKRTKKKAKKPEVVDAVDEPRKSDISEADAEGELRADAGTDDADVVEVTAGDLDGLKVGKVKRSEENEPGGTPL